MFLVGVVLLLIASPVTLVVGQEITVGGTLIVDLIAEPATIDPYTGSWNSGHVGAQLFNSLLRFDKNLKSEPCLATKWEVNPAQGTYTFELRKGVLWHDGKPFTAADVKFTLEQLVPKYGLMGSGYLRNTTVEIKGESTIVVKPGQFLPAVQMTLFSSTDTSIYPKHVLEGQDFLKSTFRTTNPIGTGPFKMKTYVKGNYMELERNENYWNKPRPYLEKIVFKFVREPAAIVAGLQSGEIHYIFRGVPFEAYDTLKQVKSLKVIPHMRPPYVSAIWINVGAPYLSDVNVRRAISYAVNRTDIAKKATYGLSKPSQITMDPELVPPSPTMTAYGNDLAKANSLLDSAGYKKGADGVRFSLELLTRTGEPDEQLWAQLVRDQLANVGISISIKTVDFATFQALQAKYQYQICTVKYWISPIWSYQLFDSEFIGRGPLYNPSQYNNPKVDQLFDGWLGESDPAKQVQLMHQVQDILSQDLPLIVLYQVAWLNVINTNFEGPDLPVGKYVFYDSLEYTYSAAAQKVTTTTPKTTLTTTTAAAQDNTMITVGAVVLVLAVAAGALLLRKKQAKPSK
jgi:peptide/nickel transport system substrate-binding protein